MTQLHRLLLLAACLWIGLPLRGQSPAQQAEPEARSAYILVVATAAEEPLRNSEGVAFEGFDPETYDQVRMSLRRERYLSVAPNMAPAETLLARLTERGGTHGRVFLRGALVSAWLTKDQVKDAETWPEVESLVADELLEGQLSVSTSALRANKFWGAGFHGGDFTSFESGILDSGIDASHPGLVGKSIYYSVIYAQASGDSGFADAYTPDDLANHGTPVVGIVQGAGSPGYEGNRGVAFGLKNVVNMKSAFKNTSGGTGLYYSDAIDNIDWGIFSAPDDIDSLNFSYGSQTSFDDSALARFMDATVDALGIPVIISAGNYGPSTGTLVDPGTSYNAIVVGSIYDFGTNTRSDDLVSVSSSRGPTAGGRKKPDLVAPGGFINSPNAKWETQTDYVNFSGTSFAAPHITGAVHLLMDALGPPVDPRVLKALLINGAEDWGTLEWNASYGWGYTNLERTLSMLNSAWLHTVAEKNKPGDFKLYRGSMAPMDNVTVVWNRHVNYTGGGFYPGTWYGLNDLNMFLYDESDGTLLDSSTSGIDNVEQVSVTAGTYDTVVKVRANDTVFSAVANETYSLVGPAGYQFPSDLPQPGVELFLPEPLLTGQHVVAVAEVQNQGDFNCFHANVSLGGFSGTGRVMGTDTQGAGSLPNNESQSRLRAWALDTGAYALSQTLTADVAADGYGESWSGSGQEAFTVATVATDSVQLEGIQIADLGGGQFQVQAELRNAGSITSATSSLRILLDGDASLVTGSSSVYFGSIASGALPLAASWLVQSAELPTVALVGEGFFGGTRSRAVFTTAVPDLPVGAVRFGAATPGKQGAPVIGVNFAPTLGNAAFAVATINTLAGSFGALAWSVQPLLAPIPVVGIDLWIDPVGLQLAPAVSDAAGVSTHAFPIPNDPALLGAKLHFQSVWGDAAGPAGFSATSGLAVTVQL